MKKLYNLLSNLKTLVCRTLSSFKVFQKRGRNTYRNLGFGALAAYWLPALWPESYPACKTRLYRAGLHRCKIKHPGYATVIGFLIALLSVQACQKSDEVHEQKTEVAIAAVNGKVLSIKELKEMYPDHLNRPDSVLIANALADRWIRKEVFLSEAERSMGDIRQLNALVSDYRESLIIHRYEEQLLQSFSDTVVTDDDIQTFFNQNPDQFKLKKTIVKFNLAVFPKFALEDEYDKFKELWDDMEDEEKLKIELVKYLDLYSEAFVLDTVWHELDELQTLLPELLPKNLLNKSYRLELEDENHFYFLKIIDIAEETDDAPLTYIRNFAQKAILQKRKLNWLEKVKENLYQEALLENKIIKYEN